MSNAESDSLLHRIRMLIDPASITLGILAGGRAKRLGGLDKAWLEHDGVPQVMRIAHCFDGQVAMVIVSANRDLLRYAEHGLTTVADILADSGPIGGLDAMARTCTTPWLLTLPVDVLDVSDSVLRMLAAEAAGNGAFAVDDHGLQPLIALWWVEALRESIGLVMAGRDLAIHALQQRLKMARVDFIGVRFGNLNSPADLIAAGMSSCHE